MKSLMKNKGSMNYFVCVAENSSVCLCSGKLAIIERIVSAKPISNVRSASSITKYK